MSIKDCRKPGFDDYQALFCAIDTDMDAALTAATQRASNRQLIRKILATVLEKINTSTEGASPCEPSYADIDHNHDIPKEPYTNIKVSSLLCTKAITQ
jgi:hypothetical protein